MKRNRAALIFGLTVLAVFAVAALFPSVLAPYGPTEMGAPWQKPSVQHLLGTNDLGYDLLTEMIYAARPTMLVGLAAAVFSLCLGTLIGLAAGALPGWKGEIASGVIQVFLMIPMLPAAIVVGAYCGGTLVSVIGIIAALGWCATARTVRARTVQLMQSEFAEGFRVLGFSRARIVLRHVLPNLQEVVLSRYIMTVARCVMLEATLSFLGLGDASRITWGRMIHLAYKRGGFTNGAWNWLAAPGVCIFLLVLAMYAINTYFESRGREVTGGRSYLD